MYPRNAASPPRVAIGAVVQISDGAVQTSGCTVRILEQGGAEGDGGGTTAYSTDGVVLYTPTQAETDQAAFILIAKKTGCIPASVTVVTTASATAGHVVLSAETHTGAVVPTVTTLTGHTAQTGDSYARLGAPAGASVSADIAAVKSDSASILADTGTDGVVVAAGSKSGYSLAADQSGVTIGTVTTLTGHTAQTGDAFARLGAPAGASVSADVAAIKAETAAILTDTNELQTDNIPGTLATIAAYLDTEVAAILEDTGTTLPAAIAAIKAETAAILTDTAEIGAAGAGLSAVPWNAAWDAEVQSEVNDALVAADASDSATLTAGTLMDRVRKIKWAVANKMEVTEADGTVVLYQDDGTTAADVGTPAMDSAAGITTRDALYGTT